MPTQPRRHPAGGGATPRITIAGAGAIGCFTGALLAHAGHRVTLLARPRIIDEVTQYGLTISDFSGLSLRVPSDHLCLSDTAACLAQADLILITVKSGATAEMAALIARHAPETTPVISLQNGIANADLLRATLPDHDIRAGMVPFNVVAQGQGRFHRATSGDILIGAGATDLAAPLSVAHLNIAETADITAIQWGKLLINLNNALNALSGLTLRDMLMHRDWRALMADQMTEALAVLKSAAIPARSTTPAPLGLIPHILRLPTFAFTRIAAQMLTVDPAARTSMSYDLSTGRPTEIDAFQGVIISLGQAHGVATPLAAHITGLIRSAEASGAGLPHLTPSDLRPTP